MKRCEFKSNSAGKLEPLPRLNSAKPFLSFHRFFPLASPSSPLQQSPTTDIFHHHHHYSYTSSIASFPSSLILPLKSSCLLLSFPLTTASLPFGCLARHCFERSPTAAENITFRCFFPLLKIKSLQKVDLSYLFFCLLFFSHISQTASNVSLPLLLVYLTLLTVSCIRVCFLCLLYPAIRFIPQASSRCF